MPTDSNMDDVEERQTSRFPLNRRETLALLGIGGLGLASSQPAAGQSTGGKPYVDWREDVTANGHQVQELGGVAMVDGSSVIRDFEGDNLVVENGVLSADAVTSHKWEDNDGNELLETPDHDGIEIDVAEIDEINNAVWVLEGDDVQTRIDAAPPEGTVIFDSSYQFDLTTPVNVTTDGLTILRPNVRAADNWNPDQTIECIFQVQADGVSISGGDIDGNSVARCGIFARDASNVDIVAVSIHDISEYEEQGAPAGIRHLRGGDITIENCHIAGVNAPHTEVARGIAANGGDDASGACQIRGNTVEDVSPVDDADGIVVRGSYSSCSVIGNRVHNAEKRSIKIQTDPPARPIVSGNTLTYDKSNPEPFCAVAIIGDHAVLTGNTIDYQTGNIAMIIIQADKPIVANNEVSVTDPGVGCDGIYASVATSSVSITDNTITGVKRDAIQLGNDFHNATINENVIVEPGRTGVYLSGVTTNVTVANNVIDDAGGRGIQILEGEQITVSGNAGTSSAKFLDLRDAADVTVGRNPGLVTQDAGSETQSGDGSTTDFTLSHGLAHHPTSITLTPKSEDAAGEFWVSNTSWSTFTITYQDPPDPGTDNLTWSWAAEQEP